MSRSHPLQSQLFPPYAAALCGGAGLLLLLLALCRTAGLSDAPSRLPVGLCLVLLCALAAGLLFYEDRRPGAALFSLLPIGLALFLRALCLEHMTYDYQDFLSGWASFFRENGGWAAVALPKGNYNVPYLYFLAAHLLSPGARSLPDQTLFHALRRAACLGRLPAGASSGPFRAVTALVPPSVFCCCFPPWYSTVPIGPSVTPSTARCASMPSPPPWTGALWAPWFCWRWPSPSSFRPSFLCRCGAHCGLPDGYGSGTCSFSPPPMSSPSSPLFF